MSKLMSSSEKQLPREILHAYALGDLDPGVRLLVAAHACYHADLTREIAIDEAIGGAFLDSTDSADVSSDALDQVMARLDDADQANAEEARLISLAMQDPDLAGLPAPLRAPTSRAFARGGWRFAAPGVRQLSLADDPELRGSAVEVNVIRLEPGRGVPEHSHSGSEMTLVMSGAFRDSRGRFGPGDLSIATPELTHRPIAEPGDVCVALAVTDAPLELTGMMGAVQRLLRRASLIN